MSLPITLLFSFVSAAQPSIFAVDTAHSSMKYEVTHKLHQVHATSTEIECKAALAPDGTLQVMVRAPVSSFKSGDGNRDEHMQEVMEAPKYAFVTFKGVGKIQIPATFPAKVSTQIQGELDLHGVKRRETIPVTLTFSSADKVVAHSNFAFSMDAYKIERPSLLFVKVEDDCKMEVELALSRVRT